MLDNSFQKNFPFSVHRNLKKIRTKPRRLNKVWQMFIITLQEPKLMSIYDITKKAMSSHRGTYYSDREVLGMILKFENPQPMTSERKLSDEVCKCYKTFIINTK
jgi:hypothetical protein